jgi:hypothetical protein
MPADFGVSFLTGAGNCFGFAPDLSADIPLSTLT